jgi:hypothetical protein
VPTGNGANAEDTAGKERDRVDYRGRRRIFCSRCAGACAEVGSSFLSDMKPTTTMMTMITRVVTLLFWGGHLFLAF